MIRELFFCLVFDCFTVAHDSTIKHSPVFKVYISHVKLSITLHVGCCAQSAQNTTES